MSGGWAWKACRASCIAWASQGEIRGGVMLTEIPEFQWCRSDLERIGHRGALEWFVMTGFLAHCPVGRLRPSPVAFSWSPERSALSDKLRQLLGIEEAA
jgi:hypothetical protein